MMILTLGALLFAALVVPLLVIAVLGGKNTRPTLNPVTLPPQQGILCGDYDGRFRLWTVDDGLRFDGMPPQGNGGPSMVPMGRWHVAVETTYTGPVRADLPADREHTLIAWRGDVLAGEIERHPLHGTKYPTREDADRVAYEAGLTGFMVYRTDAHRYGLPA